MNRYEAMFRKVRAKVVHYARMPETKRAFREEVEKTFFSNGETKDDYDPEISSWRRYMPKITRNDIEVFMMNETRLIISVTGTDDQTLNDLYASVITEKVVSDLLGDSCMEKYKIESINNGDGDEGCIYIDFKNPSPRKFYINI